MLAVFGLGGPWEYIIVLVVVMIFFGAGKLPQVLGQMGRGVKAFKDGMNEKDAELLSQNTIESVEGNVERKGAESSAERTAGEKVKDAQEV